MRVKGGVQFCEGALGGRRGFLGKGDIPSVVDFTLKNSATGVQIVSPGVNMFT